MKYEIIFSLLLPDIFWAVLDFLRVLFVFKAKVVLSWRYLRNNNIDNGEDDDNNSNTILKVKTKHVNKTTINNKINSAVINQQYICNLHYIGSEFIFKNTDIVTLKTYSCDFKSDVYIFCACVCTCIGFYVDNGINCFKNVKIFFIILRVLSCLFSSVQYLKCIVTSLFVLAIAKTTPTLVK